MPVLVNRSEAPAAFLTGTNMRRPLILLALAALVAGAVLFWSWRKSPPPELLRSELILQDGRLHRKGGAAPFTGRMIERYQDGALKSRSSVVAGVLDGLSEGWYPHGQIEVQEHFRGGVSHGLRTKWHENGTKMSESTIVAGKHHGIYRRWHDNGQLAEQMEMQEGEPGGVSAAYYPTGFLKARATLDRGKVVEQKFWKDGELREPPATGSNRE